MNAAIITPDWCADAWAMHQVFRNLGFEAEDIYFDHELEASVGKPCVLVSVKQGEVTFTVTIAPVDLTHEACVEISRNFVAQMGVASDAELRAVYRASKFQQELPRVDLILAMLRKGITLRTIPPEHAAALAALKGKL